MLNSLALATDGFILPAGTIPGVIGVEAFLTTDAPAITPIARDASISAPMTMFLGIGEDDKRRRKRHARNLAIIMAHVH